MTTCLSGEDPAGALKRRFECSINKLTAATSTCLRWISGGIKSETEGRIGRMGRGRWLKVQLGPTARAAGAVPSPSPGYLVWANPVGFGTSVGRREAEQRDCSAELAATLRYVGIRGLLCVGVLLVGTTALSPASAQEKTSGFFKAITEIFKPPDDAEVNVPKRRVEPKASDDSTSTEEPAQGVTFWSVPELEPVRVPKRRRTPRQSPEPVHAEPSADVRSLPQSAASELIVVPKRQGAVQPSHVFQAVQDLISEIRLVRAATGVTDFPPEAEFLEDRSPIHTYAKSLGVLEKLSRIQHRLGVPEVRVGQIPIKEIGARDVIAIVDYLLDEVRRLKLHLGVTRQISPAALETGKTSSMIYKSLADVSFLLDGLLGRPLSPDDVYGNALYILDEVALIASHLQVPLALELPSPDGPKRASDVAQQLLRATYKVLNLQAGLRMNASAIPTSALVRVTPSENFEATNLMLAELVRIKLHLGIDDLRDERVEEPEGKSSTDVFALVRLIIRNLDRVMRNTGAQS